jgi:hypothetical protein
MGNSQGETRGSEVPDKTAGFLRGISVGKYDNGLYLQERRQQSSVCGGICTILLAIMLITYAAVIFTAIFKRDEYTLQESSVLFEESGILDATLKDLHTQFPRDFELELRT